MKVLWKILLGKKKNPLKSKLTYFSLNWVSCKIIHSRSSWVLWLHGSATLLSYHVLCQPSLLDAYDSCVLLCIYIGMFKVLFESLTSPCFLVFQLRMVIYIANEILKYLRRKLLYFPSKQIFQWLTGTFYQSDSILLKFLCCAETKTYHQTVFQIKLKSSSFTSALTTKNYSPTHDFLTIKEILLNIIDGTIFKLK